MALLGHECVDCLRAVVLNHCPPGTSSLGVRDPIHGVTRLLLLKHGVPQCVNPFVVFFGIPRS